jgi:hypothetical protein
MPVWYPHVISTLALILGIVDLILIVWDRMPRLTVTAEAKYDTEWDEQIRMEVPLARLLWIDIVNHSSRRIWVSSVSAEWSRRRFLPSRRYAVDCPDLQRWEQNFSAPTSRFWIEPWGNVILTSDADELEDEIKDHKAPGTLWYRIAVRDGLGKWYRSEAHKLKVPKKS